MLSLSISKRTTRQLLLVLVIIVLVVYLPLNIVYIVISARNQHALTASGTESTKPKSDISVQVRNVQLDTSGSKANVELSLNIKDILRFLEGGDLNNGEATSNPTPKDVRILIHNPKMCETSRKIKYIVYVHSSPENRAKRDMLRSTWLSRSLFSERFIERAFLMGMSTSSAVQQRIETESDEYGDIIQGDFIDDYQNLTLKALLGLQWVSTYCEQATFAIKIDDDAFVNIFKLVHLLEQYEKEDKKKVLACLLHLPNSMPILRDSETCMKWCVKFNEFPGKRYFPQYCAGLTFILSQDLIPLLYNMSKSTPFFWIDDVYITGLLATKVENMEYIPLGRNFSLNRDKGKSQLEDLKQPLTYLSTHVSKLDEFMLMWKLLLNRLPLEDVLLLSTDTIEVNLDLKRLRANMKMKTKT